MSKGINRVTLLGHVGRDPELKYTPNNVAVASFSIATSERFKDKSGNWQDKTEWHNCVAWQRTAEIVGEYLKKGQQVYVEGKLQTRSWEAGGEKKYKTEIVINELVLLGKGEGRTAEVAPRSNAVTPDNPIDDSDIPF